MYGAYRNSGISVLRNYDEAAKWCEATPPIRGKGRNAGLKPLGHRNRMHFQISMDADKNVLCRLYDTDVVVFHPDNTVSLRADRFDTQTTANFISDVLGIHCGIRDHSVVVSVGNGYFRMGKGLKIVRSNTTSRWEAIEAETVYTYAINRKRMNELRRETAAFKTYMSGALKVRGYEFEPETRDAFFQDHLPDMGYNKMESWTLQCDYWRTDPSDTLARMNKFLGLVHSGEAGNWYRASLWLVFSARHTWRGSHPTKVGSEEVFKLLDDVLIATHPDALNEVPVNAGEVKRNTYKKFKPYKELANVTANHAA